jgi:hypothetical protein
MTIQNQRQVEFAIPCAYLNREETDSGTIYHFSDGDLFLKKSCPRRYNLERRIKEAHSKHCKKFRIVMQFDLHKE